MEIFLRIIAIAVLSIIATTAQARDRGYFWNNDSQSWEWRGGGAPTRPYPSWPVYPQGQIPERNLDCRGLPCMNEFHSWGGYDRRQRFDQWGYPLR
jgi:hypothetical protein